MKLRQSGIPEEEYWETLLDVPLILDRLEIDSHLGDVGEMGAGYGTFTIPVARRISGALATFDIDPAMIERTRQRVTEAGIGNVLYAVRGVFAEGFGGEPARAFCLIFSTVKNQREC